MVEVWCAQVGVVEVWCGRSMVCTGGCGGGVVGTEVKEGESLYTARRNKQVLGLHGPLMAHMQLCTSM